MTSTFGDGTKGPIGIFAAPGTLSQKVMDGPTIPIPDAESSGGKRPVLCLHPDGATVAVHCRLHTNCRANRKYRKAPLGFLLAWEALAADEINYPDTEEGRAAHQQAKVDSQILTLERRRTVRRWAEQQPSLKGIFEKEAGVCGVEVGGVAEPTGLPK